MAFKKVFEGPLKASGGLLEACKKPLTAFKMNLPRSLKWPLNYIEQTLERYFEHLCKASKGLEKASKGLLKAFRNLLKAF